MSDKKVIEQVETVENVKKRPLKNLRNSKAIYGLFLRKWESGTVTFNDVKNAYIAELEKTMKENEHNKILESGDSGKRRSNAIYKSAKRVRDSLKTLTRDNIFEVIMAFNTLRDSNWSNRSEEATILSQQLTSAIFLLNELENF